MKITGIMLVFLSSVFIGIYFSGRFKKRIQALERINTIIISIKIMIESQSLTVEELFYALVNEKKLDDFFISESAFLSSDYKQRIKDECEKISFLTEEDKRLFISFINELGITYMEGQISIINAYIKQFENTISNLKSQQSSKCRMYNSFGVLAGAFLSIILL